LTSGLREREIDRDPANLRPEPPARPVAWLSPAAREHGRPLPSASTRIRAAATASVTAAPVASVAPVPDAGTEAEVSDAGAESDADAEP